MYMSTPSPHLISSVTVNGLPPDGRSQSRSDSANRPTFSARPLTTSSTSPTACLGFQEMEPAPERATEEATHEPSSSPPPLPAAPRSTTSEMEEINNISAVEEPGVWDWGNLLDFTIDEDDSLILPWDSEDRPIPTAESSTALVSFPPVQEALPPALTQTNTKPNGELVRVRKRDPRLVCENFLAGRIPCSCPEMDEMDEKGEEVEEELGGEVNGAARKKVRTAGTVVAMRCQVPGCEADIRELKGYHRRHRVCLRCANATSVILEGQPKRYCQQCGKFHILTDFDEGKRSCRRKLERHNKRRRRRFTDYNVVEKENELQNAACDGEQAKEVFNGVAHGSDRLCISTKTVDAETSLESEEGRGSPFCSVPSVPTVQSNSGVSFQASGASQLEERIHNSRSTLSSSFGDNKSAYSAMCPTGRLSFKLYDWNPAEFPRRLRHQIFQWLASMPVELEGYIRPGCTILTVFFAMPQFMWKKLSEDAVSYLNDLVKAPESLFKGRGDMRIFFNNMMFQVVKDGTSMMNVKIEMQVPKLHYVYPNYFEAGKAMEFVACGNNLLRAKFRFLVSFAGKYLAYQSCEAISHGMSGSCTENEKKLSPNSYHEIYRIKIPHTEPELFGPAFIEVENEAGISNFIPVLFGDRHICSELERLLEPYQRHLCFDGTMSQIADASVVQRFCDTYVSKQTLMSELLLDIAWLLKEPSLNAGEAFLSAMQIQRVNCLLKVLIDNESVSVLRKILHYLEILIDGKDLSNAVSGAYDADISLFGKYINSAREVLHQKQCSGRSEVESENSTNKGVPLQQSDSRCDLLYTIPRIINQGGETSEKDGVGSTKTHAHHASEEDVPLVIKEIITLRADFYCPLVTAKTKWQQDSCVNLFSRTITRSRLAVLIMVGAVMCFGLCVSLLHPHKGRDFAVSVRTFVFGGRNRGRF